MRLMRGAILSGTPSQSVPIRANQSQSEPIRANQGRVPSRVTLIRANQGRVPSRVTLIRANQGRVPSRVTLVSCAPTHLKGLHSSGSTRRCTRSRTCRNCWSPVRARVEEDLGRCARIGGSRTCGERGGGRCSEHMHAVLFGRTRARIGGSRTRPGSG